jgi:hypothetical protein
VLVEGMREASLDTRDLRMEAASPALLFNLQSNSIMLPSSAADPNTY